MKLLSIYVLFLALLYGVVVWYPNSNWYPFGYPVQPGDLWQIEYKYHEGSPIEEVSIHFVRVDSVFQGYVIKAHYEKNGTEFGKSTMRRFTRTWPFNNSTAKLIERK